MLKIAVPNKGRLSESTLELFGRAGLRVETLPERRLFASALDGELQILFVRAQDIPEYVQDGVAHLGVTGLDLVEETGKDVERLMDLRFGKCRLVLAVPEDSPVKAVADIPEGSKVATSFPRLAERYFTKHKRKVRVVEVSGATEITPHIGVADYVVDLVSTGSTLAMNALREVDTLVNSTAHVIGNRQAMADPKLKTALTDLLAALQSVIAAKGKRYLMANVPRARLDEVKRILPGINGPTIMEVLDKQNEYVAAHAVVDDTKLYRIVNDLKAIGATGILVLPIERLVP